MGLVDTFLYCTYTGIPDGHRQREKVSQLSILRQELLFITMPMVIRIIRD